LGDGDTSIKRRFFAAAAAEASALAVVASADGVVAGLVAAQPASTETDMIAANMVAISFLAILQFLLDE
jgi:hypothetical protein